MAVKYVKDFSFPSSAGFTGSTGQVTQVRPHTRQAFAHGGKVRAAKDVELGSGLAGLAKGALLGRKKGIDDQIEGIVGGLPKKRMIPKGKKPPPKRNPRPIPLADGGRTLSRTMSRAMAAGSMTDEEMARMDKMMAKGQENYERTKKGKGTLDDPIYPQNKLGGIKGTIGRNVFGSKVVTDSEKARYKAATALMRRKAARGKD